MMNRANFAAIGAGLFFLVLAKAILDVSGLLPAVTMLFVMLAAILAATGVVIIFYSFTFVGNLTIRRRVFNENIAMVILIGKGGFCKWTECNLNKPTFEIEGKVYNILHENLIIRKGIPIAVLLVDHENSVPVMNIDPAQKIDPWVVTSFIKTIDSLNKAEAFNKIYNNLFLLNLAILGLQIISMIFIFVMFGDTKNSIADTQKLIYSLKPTVTAIASAIPSG